MIGTDEEMVTTEVETAETSNDDRTLSDLLLPTGQSRGPDGKAVEAPTVSKIQATSSIRAGLELSQGSEPRGLLRFFKPCTVEVYNLQLAQEQEQIERQREEDQHQNELATHIKTEAKREGARLRKQKERSRKKDRDIQQGIRSPGGKKRKVM